MIIKKQMVISTTRYKIMFLRRCGGDLSCMNCKYNIDPDCYYIRIGQDQYLVDLCRKIHRWGRRNKFRHYFPIIKNMVGKI